MAQEYIGLERREFLRYDYDKPISYRPILSSKETLSGSSFLNAKPRNLSASGLLFVTKVSNVPDMATLLVIDLDYRTAAICQEIENQALILDNKLIGKVVRIEDNEDGTCGVGVAFLTKTDPIIKNIKGLKNLLK
jgi:hypothetical protein